MGELEELAGVRGVEYGEKSAGAVRILEAISLYIHADIRSKWLCSLHPLATDGGKA